MHIWLLHWLNDVLQTKHVPHSVQGTCDVMLSLFSFDFFSSSCRICFSAKIILYLIWFFNYKSYWWNGYKHLFYTYPQITVKQIQNHFPSTTYIKLPSIFAITVYKSAIWCNSDVLSNLIESILYIISFTWNM